MNYYLEPQITKFFTDFYFYFNHLLFTTWPAAQTSNRSTNSPEKFSALLKHSEKNISHLKGFFWSIASFFQVQVILDEIQTRDSNIWSCQFFKPLSVSPYVRYSGTLCFFQWISCNLKMEAFLDSFPRQFFAFLEAESNQNLPVTRFKPRISGVGSDYSTNWATTTALWPILLSNLCS